MFKSKSETAKSGHEAGLKAKYGLLEVQHGLNSYSTVWLIFSVDWLIHHRSQTQLSETIHLTHTKIKNTPDMTREDRMTA